MAKAGKWELRVMRGGYPAWVTVSFEDERLVQIHHEDLRDLEYAVQKAMREAKANLGKQYEHEV